jgi:hypothetical protein
MITPPLSISARPTFNRNPVLPFNSDMLQTPRISWDEHFILPVRETFCKRKEVRRQKSGFVRAPLTFSLFHR